MTDKAAREALAIAHAYSGGEADDPVATRAMDTPAAALRERDGGVREAALSCDGCGEKHDADDLAILCVKCHMEMLASAGELGDEAEQQEEKAIRWLTAEILGPVDNPAKPDPTADNFVARWRAEKGRT